MPYIRPSDIPRLAAIVKDNRTPRITHQQVMGTTMTMQEFNEFFDYNDGELNNQAIFWNDAFSRLYDGLMALELGDR